MMMRDLLLITKALSDETRVRALWALREQELCLCQLIDLLNLSPPTISKHMTQLHQAGLVLRRKEGRWHYFRLAGREAPPVVRKALRLVLDELEHDPTAQRHAQALEGVLQKDVKELCECYSKS